MFAKAWHTSTRTPALIEVPGMCPGNYCCAQNENLESLKGLSSWMSSLCCQVSSLQFLRLVSFWYPFTFNANPKTIRNPFWVLPTCFVAAVPRRWPDQVVLGNPPRSGSQSRQANAGVCVPRPRWSNSHGLPLDPWKMRGPELRVGPSCLLTL